MKQTIYIRRNIADYGNPKEDGLYQTDNGTLNYMFGTWYYRMDETIPTWWQEKEPVERWVFTDEELAEHDEKVIDDWMKLLYNTVKSMLKL